jgi:hypothetical protein
VLCRALELAVESHGTGPAGLRVRLLTSSEADIAEVTALLAESFIDYSAWVYIQPGQLRLNVPGRRCAAAPTRGQQVHCPAAR